MRQSIKALLVAALMMAGPTACADNTDRQGGGGGTAQQERQAELNRQAAERDQGARNDMGDQMRANTTVDLTTEGRDFAEAYARMPWVHANLAAGDWERALDDLQFVSQQLTDLNNDDDVSAPLKAKIMSVRPHLATLTSQIQKHDRAALQTASTALNRFAMVTNDPQILAWMGDRRRGGGAGMGDPMHDKK